MPDPDSPVELDQRSPHGIASQGTAEIRARFAQETYQYIWEFIRFADQKATFLFTGPTALLAFLYKNGISRVWLKPITRWNVLDVAGFVAMFGLSIGAFVSLLVILPRLVGSRRGYLFWGAISRYNSGSEYAKALSTLSPASLAQIKAEHCFELAKVASSKYAVPRIAFWSCAVGLVASLVLFLFGTSAPVGS